MNELYKVGIDIGSTTIKVVFINNKDEIVFSDYQRHNADIMNELSVSFLKAKEILGNATISIVITGSAGMGVSEKFNIPFIQEVVAAADVVKQKYPDVKTLIDIGGEDAKMIFFEEGKVPDIRMNGSCAGGTGAFIDQVASLLGIEPIEINTLAANYKNIYPIASRCGVFTKTDIQNLIAKNVAREDIAASVFNAVVMQTITSLARGYDIAPKVFFCGGPLTFLTELPKFFISRLNLKEEDCIISDFSQFIPALGCAMHEEGVNISVITTPTFAKAKATPPQEGNGGTSSPPVEGSNLLANCGVVNENEQTPVKEAKDSERFSPTLIKEANAVAQEKKILMCNLNSSKNEVNTSKNEVNNSTFPNNSRNNGRMTIKLSDFLDLIQNKKTNNSDDYTERLDILFANKKEFNDWCENKEKTKINLVNVEEINSNDEFYCGIDSGSTTTKIVVINSKEEIIYSFYARNNGKPLETIVAGFKQLEDALNDAGKEINISKSAVTGYGEDLVKAAFNIDFGIVETIAHYTAARKFKDDVSFILDIGGQDMKAIFVDNGAINRLEVNEACSSGCGSFIEGFANSLKYSVADFANSACFATHPCDLGTRCTVFMNSKVKQFLREGATVADIASGLAYSVVKNCLYKVLKVKNLSELGDNIVVQGGTFRNKAIVRVLEKLVEKDVICSNIPELMGGYGAALYARRG